MPPGGCRSHKEAARATRRLNGPHEECRCYQEALDATRRPQMPPGGLKGHLEALDTYEAVEVTWRF